MSRPALYKNRIHVGVRLPQHLHAVLQDVALQRDVSMNLLITRAVERYLNSIGALPEQHDSEVESARDTT